MTKLLVICGPTATGKTSLGLQIAKHINGEIVSADSRQVYKGMDIGTGKDLPKNATYHEALNLKVGKDNIGFYNIENIPVWGYDLVAPSRAFSVSRYVTIVDKILGDIESRGRTPIVVGGTGFYIKAVIDGIATLNIPKNTNLRDSLTNKSVTELYDRLARLDPVKAASLNSSDRKNTRRLVRAIEVSQYKLIPKVKRTSRNLTKYHIFMVGLTAPRHFLFQKVDERIKDRLAKGFEEEVRAILHHTKWDSQALQSLGYRQWQEFTLAKKSKEAVIKNWSTEEKKYVKRQLTWFKKDKRINWFDITNKKWRQEVEKAIMKWYKE